MLEAQHGQLWELKTPEGLSHGWGEAQYYEIYLQELNKISRVNIREKSLGLQAEEGGKGINLKYTRALPS